MNALLKKEFKSREKKYSCFNGRVKSAMVAFFAIFVLSA